MHVRPKVDGTSYGIRRMQLFAVRKFLAYGDKASLVILGKMPLDGAGANGCISNNFS